MAPIPDTNHKGRYFYLPTFRSTVCLHCNRFQKLEFKSTFIVLPLLNMQGLVKDGMYVSQGEIPMSRRDSAYQ